MALVTSPLASNSSASARLAIARACRPAAMVLALTLSPDSILSLACAISATAFLSGQALALDGITATARIME